jgi:hypothetical protein
MRVDFENVGPAGFDIWAATVEGYRINVMKSHSNLNGQAFFFEMNVADVEWTDIAAKGFAADLETACYKATAKARELANPPSMCGTETLDAELDAEEAHTVDVPSTI